MAMTREISFGPNIAAGSCAYVDVLIIFISGRLQNHNPREFIRAAALARKDAAHTPPIISEGRSVRGHQIDEMG